VYNWNFLEERVSLKLIKKFKMTLSDHNNKTLMLALHQKIEEHADYIAKKLHDSDLSDLLTYPPGSEMTKDELLSLKALSNDKNIKSGIKKILADNAAGIIFELLNYIDGTSDPDKNLGKWSEVSFVDKSDDINPPHEMLHDNFFETYWDWEKINSNS
jgi:hypothetical protein